MDWSTAGLRAAGFTGFVPFAALSSANVPLAEGVYVVVRPTDADPVIRETSPAGWFKGRNPSVPAERLQQKWPDGAHVVYIGKATAQRPRRGLAKRLDEYARYGAGEPVGHQGGRFVWQLADSDDLLVAWRTCSDATAEESRLLDQFFDDHGALPFANLRR